MPRMQSRPRRQAAFMEAAQHMYTQLEDWYEAHPQASFGEIEGEARQQRRTLMGHGLALLVNGRDTGFQLDAPPCQKCGEAMEFEGYRPWQVHGLEGESALERAYYVCPTCPGETLFPPGSEIEVAG